MNLEKLNLKIKKTFPNENLTVMEYSNMKSYFVIKCNNCNKVYKFQRAENFFKRKTRKDYVFACKFLVMQFLS